MKASVAYQAAGPAGGAPAACLITASSARRESLAETGQLDLGSMISHCITLDQINHGITLLTRTEGTRTIIT